MVSGSASTPDRRGDGLLRSSPVGPLWQPPGGEGPLSAKEYIEAIAEELARVRGRGLLLSPADVQLALGWHAAEIPLPAVLAEVRKASRLRARSAGARGAAEMLISLQALAPAIERLRPRRLQPRPTGLGRELRDAAGKPG